MSCFNYISPEAAERFFSDEAKNEKLGWFPPELLVSGRQVKRMVRQARSEKPESRAVAAANPSTPDSWLAWLAVDDSILVRRAVVKNLKVTEDVLIQMQVDEDDGIATYAQYRLDNGLYRV